MSKRRNEIVIVLAAVLSGCTAPMPSAARAEPAPQGSRQHPWEFTLSGVGVSNENFDTGGFQLVGGVGHYVNELLEVGVRQNISMADAGAGQSADWNGATRIALDLHIPLGTLVPYVGGNFGYVYGETTDDRFAAGPEGGVKLYVQPDTFVQLAIEYVFFFENSDQIGDAFDDGTAFYSLGFGIRF